MKVLLALTFLFSSVFSQAFDNASNRDASYVEFDSESWKGVELVLKKDISLNYDDLTRISTPASDHITEIKISRGPVKSLTIKKGAKFKISKVTSVLWDEFRGMPVDNNVYLQDNKFINNIRIKTYYSPLNNFEEFKFFMSDYFYITKPN